MTQSSQPNGAVRALLDAALGYARRGWPVFPLHPIVNGRCACNTANCDDVGKHPASKGWPNTIASVDAVPSLWADRHGPRGIGLACGPRAGVWGLDVDPDKGGLGSIRKLQAEHGPLPRTITSRTGSGGWHLIFRWADGIGLGAGVAPGLDWRGQGGYLVLAPSPHACGGRYQWVFGPEDQEPADAPGWLLELIAAKSKRNTPAAPAGDRLAVPAGARHDALVRLLGLVRSLGYGEAMLVAVANAFMTTSTELSDDENRRSVDLANAEATARDIARRYPPARTNNPERCEDAVSVLGKALAGRPLPAGTPRPIGAR